MIHLSQVSISVSQSTLSLSLTLSLLLLLSLSLSLLHSNHSGSVCDHFSFQSIINVSMFALSVALSISLSLSLVFFLCPSSTFCYDH